MGSGPETMDDEIRNLSSLISHQGARAGNGRKTRGNECVLGLECGFIRVLNGIAAEKRPKNDVEMSRNGWKVARNRLV
jgi:hypothetical protein